MGRTLSIEIKNRNIKILEGSRNGSSVAIYKNILVYVKSGSIDDGRITDMDSVVETLENIFANNKIKTKNAILIINTNSTITRVMELPLLKSKSETMSMVRSELDQLLPIDLNQYQLVYKLTDTFNDEGIEKGRYIVYGLPTNIYDEYIQLAERLKLELKAIDLASNCLDKITEHNLTINKEHLKTDEAAAFIDVGYSNITFSVVCNGKDVFTRISSNGVNDLIKNYSAVFNLSLENAIEELKTLSLTDYEENLMDTSKLSILEDNVSMWVDEFNRYIRYYNSNNKDNQIQKIYIYGTYSNINGLKDYLESHLNNQTLTINEISNVSYKGNLNADNFDFKAYLNSILSLYIDKKDINFLTDKKKKHKSNFKAGVAVLAITTIALLTTAYYGYEYYVEKINLKNDIATFEKFILNQENIKVNNEALDIKNKAQLLQKYIDEVNKLKTAIKIEDAVNSIIFEQLAHALPLGSKVNSISVDKESIQLQCSSDSREEVAQFERNLKAIEFIDNVYIPAVVDGDEEGNTTYSYSVICDMKGVITDEAE